MPQDQKMSQPLPASENRESDPNQHRRFVEMAREPSCDETGQAI